MMMMMLAPPVSTPPDRGREPAALCRRLEFGHRLPLRRKASGKELPVPAAGDDLPAIVRQFVGEILRVADAEKLGARVVPQAPGRKADRGQMRLQVARRHVDDGAHFIVFVEIIFHPRGADGRSLLLTAVRWNGNGVERGRVS